MRQSAASITSQGLVPWLRKHGFPVRLVGCSLFVAFSAFFSGIAPAASPIRVASGVMLAYLLLAPRKRWLAYGAAGMVALAAGSVFLRVPWQTNLPSTALSLVEVLLAASLLRKRSAQLPRFTDGAYLLRFIGYAILVAPLATGLIYALTAAQFKHAAPVAALAGWTVADALGIAVATPVCVAIFRARFIHTFGFGVRWIYPLLLAAVALAAFSQSKVALLFIVYPLLLMILLRMGLGWAMVCTLFVTGLGSWSILRGRGPLTLSNPLTPLEPAILLAVFLASATFLLYAVSEVLKKQQTTVRQLKRIAALHALVGENSRDAIILADLSGHRSYVSSAAESLGWKPEELVTQNGVEMVHPEDRVRAQAIVRELNSGTERAMIECRVRKPKGEYIWVEASLRVVRDPETGVPTGMLNIVRDVSERKLVEKRLQEAYNAVEALAVTDALTGLANRRRFDECLATEWRRAARERQPLSLLMLDVDQFKVYNDTYGHQRGDSCLKQVAEACMDVVSRPGDLVARFGGEEFVVILPNTEGDGAMHVADEICEALRSRRLPHGGNPLGIVTISIGCATLVPKFGKHAANLIQIADEALYKAKQGGRDQACNGNTMQRREEDAQLFEPLDAAAGERV